MTIDPGIVGDVGLVGVMRILVALGALGLAAASTPRTDAAEPSPAADPVQVLQQLTQDRFDANARNDRAFYEGLLAPAFLFLGPHTFPPATKADYLDAEFPPHRAPKLKSTISAFQASVDGDTAVVGYTAVEPYPLGAGRQFEQASRRLDTYVRIDGTWRLLSMAVAEPPSWPDVAVIDPRLYAEYAGIYELSPDTRVVITNERGRLMAEVTRQSKVELYPENDTTFFDKTDSPGARTVFERDRSGKVVAQVYRASGQNLRARKIR